MSETPETPPTGEPDEETTVDNANSGQADAAEPGEIEPDTFPRDYVERLRRENAGYRERAGRAGELATRLHTALVTATGRLADPSDLPFDDAHLYDPDALTAAIDELLDHKPHLASRRPTGDVGQGARASGESVDLAGMLRARVG